MTFLVELEAPPRAVLGCIQVGTDFVLDCEGPALIALFPGVEIRLQKIPLIDLKISTNVLRASAIEIPYGVSALQPIDRCTIIGLACTSFAITLGESVVDELLKRAATPITVTTDMARAQVRAIKTLGARKVALLTPYIEEVSLANSNMLEQAGIRVISRITMELDRDELSSRVNKNTIIEWAKRVNTSEAEVIVIGCSALRVCSKDGFIDTLEEEIGKPVVTSTQAFMWDMLRNAGVSDQVPGYGELFLHH
jgi:maleate isomerase